jgi:hypothetical protein
MLQVCDVSKIRETLLQELCDAQSLKLEMVPMLDH